MRSTKGMIHLSPAVFTPSKRPSRNTTPRSYSVMTRAPIAKSTTATATKIRIPGKPSTISPPLLADAAASVPRRRTPHAQRHALDRQHLDLGAHRERLVRTRRPVLAAHEHASLRAERRRRAPDQADELARAGDLRAPGAARDDEEHEAAEE